MTTGIKIELDTLSFNTDDNKNNEIQYLDYNDIKYNDFFANLMVNNMPCVIKNVAQTWECSKNWVSNNHVNYDFFIKEYGDLEAPVADCDSLKYNSQCKSNMSVKDFMNYLKEDKKERMLYLKDWHLKRIKPDHNFYEVPFIFASDWLNEFSVDNQEDDFMFVYIGPGGSWTPFHCDVYSSFSWSVNIVGRKKWIILPPGEEEKLRDPMKNLPLLFESEKHPNVNYIEVYQEMGDGIFVPSGWHHQVFNLVTTISINHNFINSCNIETVWNSLQSELVLVEHEIQEFRGTPEFFDQCQLILKSVFGMDFVSFIKFITYISEKRLKQLKSNKFLIFKMYYFESNHIIYDLLALLKTIKLIEHHSLFPLLSKDTVQNLLDTKNCINESVSL